MITKYPELRRNVRTGDILAVKGSLLVRVFTGETYSHVALILRLRGGVWVAEYRERKGYQLLRLSEWVRQNRKAQYWWGSAPVEVFKNPDKVVDAAIQFRGHSYSYWTLIMVWLSQLFRRKMPGKFVCSTFVQRVWETTDWKLKPPKLADPGDIAAACRSLVPCDGKAIYESMLNTYFGI